MLSKITVSPAPHISQKLSTRGVMGDVIIGLAPAMAAAVWFFRIKAVGVIAICVISCMVFEWLCNVIRKKPNSLGDLSAVVTGLILAFSLPPAAPWWMCVIGSGFAIIICKMLFGGLGYNVFNPAMAARAFLTASFGMFMTTWTVPATMDAQMPQISATNTVAVTQATPLAWAKQAVKAKNKASSIANAKKDAEKEIERLTKKQEQLKQQENNPSETSAQQLKNTLSAADIEAKIEHAKKTIIESNQAYPNAIAETKTLLSTASKQIKQAFFGNVGGCLGETSAMALLIGGVYLLIRRTITFHIPAAVLIAAFVFAEIFYLIDPGNYSMPFLQLCGGGMLLCALFIATDPVTAPLSTKGMWIFGFGVGALIMLIRFVGEYPEGVMYAILIMNAVSPLIDRACKLIPAGGKPHVQ